MARILETQSTFSSGEADPRLAERRDVQFYYSAVSRGRQIVALPQGGFTAAPGWARESRLRDPLAPVDLSGATVTAPNGGTPANLTDGDPDTFFETNTVGAGETVAVAIALAGATDIVALDVTGFYAELAARDQCLAVDWSDDGLTWSRMPVVDIDAGAANARTRRFALPPGESVTATHLRIVTTGGAGLGKIAIGALAAWTQIAFSGAVRTVNFNFRRGQEYTIALTPGNGDVFFGGIWQAAFPIAVTAAMLPEIDWAQKLDSLLVFHETLETPLIKRQGRHTEWDASPYPYRNLPLFDFGAVYANGVDAVQRIRLYSLSSAEQFDLTLEGNTTSAITCGANDAADAAAIQAALEALPNVDPGLTVTVAADRTFDVTFTGGANAGRPWLTMAGTALDDDGIVQCREMTKGKRPGEPVMSAARGWPRTGTFWQQALLVAGLASLPRHVLKSIVADPADFNTEIVSPDGAMLFELDGGTANEILRIHAGAALLIFTRDGVSFLDGTTLSPAAAPVFKPTEQPGLQRGVPLATLEGGLVYVETGGHIVREFKFSELQRNFSAQNISVLSAHLLAGPVDLLHRRAVRAQENDLVALVNGDGTLVLLTALRSENVTGFTLRTSENGRVRAGCCDSEQTMRLAVARETAGAERLWLERIDPALVTDAATVATGEAITVVTVGEAFDGETLHVLVDRSYQGTRVVTDGAIAGLPPGSRIEAGYAVLADVVDMPLLKDEQAERPMARQKRVYTLHLSLYETDHVAVQVNGGEIFDVPLLTMGESEVGESQGDRPFTGTLHLEGFPGFTETGQVRVMQQRPGRLTVRQLRKEARV